MGENLHVVYEGGDVDLVVDPDTESMINLDVEVKETSAIRLPISSSYMESEAPPKTRCTICDKDILWSSAKNGLETFEQYWESGGHPASGMSGPLSKKRKGKTSPDRRLIEFYSMTMSGEC